MLLGLQRFNDEVQSFGIYNVKHIKKLAYDECCMKTRREVRTFHQDKSQANLLVNNRAYTQNKKKRKFIESIGDRLRRLWTRGRIFYNKEVEYSRKLRCISNKTEYTKFIRNTSQLQAILLFSRQTSIFRKLHLVMKANFDLIYKSSFFISMYERTFRL